MVMSSSSRKRGPSGVGQTTLDSRFRGNDAKLSRAHPQTRAVVIDHPESEPRIESLRGIAAQHPQLDISIGVPRKGEHCVDARRAYTVIAFRTNELDVAQKNLAPVSRQADAADVADDLSAVHD